MVTYKLSTFFIIYDCVLYKKEMKKNGNTECTESLHKSMKELGFTHCNKCGVKLKD